MTVLLNVTVFLPVSVITAVAYFCIIRKLLALRKRINLHEQNNTSQVAALAPQVEVNDSGVEMSHALDGAVGHAGGESEDKEIAEMDYDIDFNEVGDYDEYFHRDELKEPGNFTNHPKDESG